MVVLVGVAVLAVLLVVAMLSFRQPEQPAAWEPGPPMLLPTQPTPTQEPSATRKPTPSPRAIPGPALTPSSVRSPSPTVSGSSRREVEPSESPDVSDPPSLAVDAGELAASYLVTTRATDYYRARLVVHNGTGQPVGWVVDLRFTSEVTGVRAASGPGMSMSIKGAGWYQLSGNILLPAGGQQTVYLRISRTGNRNYPAQCTVNGSACAMG
ncbi:cellulose binding domain-containing protein [Micromonospora sp. DT229]|uniref:cellulose binding domain-containing protein n=1 Tax=Micromonospora sp. DT229 TaxID=3393430 RepID=UPI003CEBD49E